MEGRTRVLIEARMDRLKYRIIGENGKRGMAA